MFKLFVCCIMNTILIMLKHLLHLLLQRFQQMCSRGEPEKEQNLCSWTLKQCHTASNENKEGE